MGLIKSTITLVLVVIAAKYLYFEYDRPTLCLNEGDAACFFSPSYFQARALFLQQAAAAGAQLHRLDVDTREGWYIDVALLQGSDVANNNVLLHVSGTHGCEGFVGSAVQSSYLSTLAAAGPYKGAATLLFVHALNPAGFALGRRVNENNVDLNRNTLFTEQEWRDILTRDRNIAGYFNVSDAFNPARERSLLSDLQSMYTLIVTIAKHGIPALKKASVTAQYHMPTGTSYGGKQLEKSHVLLSEFLKSNFENVQHFVMIDVHSGLGPKGKDTLLVDTDEATARKVFSNRENPYFDLQAFGSVHETGAASGYELTRGTTKAYQKLFPNKKSSIVLTQEFGTYPTVIVGQSLVWDNQGHFYGGRKPEQTIEAFNPTSDTFRRRVVARGNILIQQAIDHLLAQ